MSLDKINKLLDKAIALGKECGAIKDDRPILYSNCCSSSPYTLHRVGEKWYGKCSICDNHVEHISFKDTPCL